jgi:exosortase
MDYAYNTIRLNPKKGLLGMESAIVLGLWAATFVPVYPRLFEAWLFNPDDSHGFLVPLISAYFIWRKRDKIIESTISSSNWGVAILAVSMGWYVLSFAGGIEFVSRCMIVCSLVGLVLLCAGKEFFKLVSFPVLFLFFMVPIPISIEGMVSFPLQLFATGVARFVIQGLSIPVYQEGNMLYFAQTQLEVAEACSGLRSIVSLTMLSVIFAYLLNKGWKRRIVLLVSAVPLAIFVNIVRVSGTGVLAHFFGSRVARGFLHEFSGMAVFAFGFLLLFGEYLLLNRAGTKE